MSQQIFDKHWPLAKNGANELIPGAAILQTRDDKDEPITLAAAVQWDESSGLFLPTHKENPLEVRVREVEAKLDELKQTIESGVQLKGSNVAKTYLKAESVGTGYENRVSTGWINAVNNQIVVTAAFEPGGTEDFEVWVEWGNEDGSTLIPFERVFKTTSSRRGTFVLPVRGSRFILQVRNYGATTLLRGLDVVQIPGSQQVSIVGRRALTGDLGDTFSFVLDEDGIPVLRVVDAAPFAYDEANNALRSLPLYMPNTEIHRVQNFEVTGTTGNLGRFSLLGYSHYYVLVRSNTAHSFKVETYGVMVGGTFGEQATDFQTVLEVQNGTRDVSEHLPTIGQDQFFRITRTDSQPAAHYDVVIFGVV